jgi:hypothetical protein
MSTETTNEDQGCIHCAGVLVARLAGDGYKCPDCGGSFSHGEVDHWAGNLSDSLTAAITKPPETRNPEADELEAMVMVRCLISHLDITDMLDRQDFRGVCRALDHAEGCLKNAREIYSNLHDYYENEARLDEESRGAL